MNKKLITSLVIALVLCLCLTLFACGADGKDGKDGVNIESIAKTGTNGNVDTYTITLTNGNMSTFTVTNGVESKNDTFMGEEPTEDLLEYCPLDDGTLGVRAGRTYGLSSVVIPATHDGKTVTVLLGHAFEDGRLENITIPNTITCIDYRALAYINLTSITYLGTKEQLYAIQNSNAITYRNDCVIHCTDGDIETSQHGK